MTRSFQHRRKMPAGLSPSVRRRVPKSNLENFLVGYNLLKLTEYPIAEKDGLLKAYIRGYNLDLIG